MSAVQVLIEGRELRLTNLDKVLWPLTGTTKRDLIDYYRSTADVILPHIAGHGITLGRFPDGIDGPGWFQTTCHHHPEWMRTFTPARSTQRYCVIEEPAALVWAANIGAIELHPLLGTTDPHLGPSQVIFDLDPGEPPSPADSARVALLLRNALDDYGLRAFPKLSGWTGMHLHVPLDGRSSFDQTKSFARALSERLAGEHPDLIVARADRGTRGRRVFIDWVANDANRSLVAPYSLRAMPRPTVAAPLAWKEVEAAAQADEPIVFGPAAPLDRLDRLGDLSAPRDLNQSLPNGVGERPRESF